VRGTVARNEIHAHGTCRWRSGCWDRCPVLKGKVAEDRVAPGVAEQSILPGSDRRGNALMHQAPLPSSSNARASLSYRPSYCRASNPTGRGQPGGHVVSKPLRREVIVHPIRPSGVVPRFEIRQRHARRRSEVDDCLRRFLRTARTLVDHRVTRLPAYGLGNRVRVIRDKEAACCFRRVFLPRAAHLQNLAAPVAGRARKAKQAETHQCPSRSVSFPEARVLLFSNTMNGSALRVLEFCKW